MKTDHEIKLGVSLCSYQDSCYFGRQDLEGCIAAAAGSGAEGFEIFADAMIDEWPNSKLSDAFLEKWNHRMKQYDMVPVCLDHFSHRAMWHDRQLTDDELVDRSILYIKTAAQLGCHCIRLLHNEHVGGMGLSPCRLSYVHSKFYEFDENGQVDNMDYPAIFKALKDGGYKGYISSEFEGNRRMNDDRRVDDIDYVRRHQALMRQCLGYTD